MTAIDVFTVLGATTSMAVTAGSAVVALTDIGHLGGDEVRVVNAGTVNAFIEFGNSAVSAATSTSIIVLAGTVEVFGVGPGATHVAAIAPSGTPTLYFTTGRGA
jgi:hypothetical protein